MWGREEGDLGRFYRHPQMRDGRRNHCQECKKAEIKRNRSLKGGRYAEYERKRNQTEKRKAYHAANVSSWRGEDLQRWRYNWPGIGCES